MSRRLSGFGSPPAKGTHRRQFLLLALRTEGISCREAIALGLVGSSQQLRGCVDALINEKGYDLRRFPCSRDRCGLRGRKYAYRLVGKMRWDGSYRSFIHRSTVDRIAA